MLGIGKIKAGMVGAMPKDNTLYRTILNAIPSPVFIVDEDVRIIDQNEAAAAMSGQKMELVLRRRGGEVLHCIHSTEVAEGCGRAPVCKACVIRNSVKACVEGQTVSRARMKMDFLPDAGQGTMELLITASPMPGGERQALLIIEDITEISTLKSIIPMCMKCRKIRSDEEYWQSVEQYFHDHIGVDFSHGICPTCVEKYYPGYRD
jgi:PAS domain-containing protein